MTAADSAARTVDFHHHFMPPRYYAEVRERVIASTGGFMAELNWTPEQSLAQLDSGGFDAAVLTLGTPGVYFGDAAQAARLSRFVNEYGAELTAAHPDRFAYLAALPLPDVDASLAEIEIAMGALGAEGVGILSSYGDIWLGDPRLDPVFDELNRRGAVVAVHPTTPVACQNIVADLPDPVLEFLFDSTRAITNLLFSGSLSRYPDIRFVFTHSAGVLPSLAHRITHSMSRLPKFAGRAPEGVPTLLGRLYFDVANTASPANLDGLSRLTTPDHVLFGSDYPFVPALPQTLGQMRASGLSEDDIGRIGRNGSALIPRWA